MVPRTARSASQARALWVLAVLASIAFVKLAAGLLIPLVLGVLSALALEPIVAWLVRHRVPRGVAAALVVGALLAGAGASGYALRDRLASIVEVLPSVARRARAMVESTFQTAQLERASNEMQGQTGERGRAQAPPPSVAAPALQRIGQSALSVLGHLTVIVFFIFFLLQSGPRMASRMADAAGTPARRALVATILTDVNRQVQRFLLVQAFTAAVVALATWVVLAWMGVAYPALWAVLAGLFNSIPYFGPVIVSGGLFVVGVAQDGGTARAVQMAVAALIITSLEGWLLVPPLMGRAERMNVLSVFVGLMLWTWLWGAWGTLLAVPMLAVVKSVADHVEPLRPVGRLMAP
jgi:predicted PurR-regulated permease PerM